MRVFVVGVVAFALMLVVATALVKVPDTDPCVGDSSIAEASPPGSGELTDLRADLVVDGLAEPTGMFTLPRTDRLFVIEKPGRIVIVEDGEILDDPVLDITHLVLSDGNERGFMSVLPAPDYEESCHLFLFYVDTRGDSQLKRVTVSGFEEPRISLATMEPVLEIPQEQRWHQSGSMVFGPDGYLWLTIGDGGFIGDPQGHGQNPKTLKGTTIRIDVSSLPYRVPESNPFTTTDDALDEIWAYGLRNPWRISIDEQTGTVYIPDAGHVQMEEINAVAIDDSGLDFGWAITEGFECYDYLDCDPTGTVEPIRAWTHDEGCAVIGGQVYRGEAIPELVGHYFFGDFCRGWIRSFHYDGNEVRDEVQWDELARSLLTSITADHHGELYFTNFQGELWKIVPERAG